MGVDGIGRGGGRINFQLVGTRTGTPGIGGGTCYTDVGGVTHTDFLACRIDRDHQVGIGVHGKRNVGGGRATVQGTGYMINGVALRRGVEVVGGGHTVLPEIGGSVRTGDSQ